jgi:hypothetical protein
MLLLQQMPQVQKQPSQISLPYSCCCCYYCCLQCQAVLMILELPQLLHAAAAASGAVLDVATLYHTC